MNPKTRIGLLSGTGALAVFALALYGSTLARTFVGSDDQARMAIGTLHPGYQPWFAPLWKPPSSEIEGILFALQAAIGAGIVGYALWASAHKTTTEKNADA